MACQFIREDDRVLEFGGSLGRNSCVINTHQEWVGLMDYQPTQSLFLYGKQ